MHACTPVWCKIVSTMRAQLHFPQTESVSKTKLWTSHSRFAASDFRTRACNINRSVLRMLRSFFQYDFLSGTVSFLAYLWHLLVALNSPCTTKTTAAKCRNRCSTPGRRCRNGIACSCCVRSTAVPLKQHPCKLFLQLTASPRMAPLD